MRLDRLSLAVSRHLVCPDKRDSGTGHKALMSGGSSRGSLQHGGLKKNDRHLVEHKLILGLVTRYAQVAWLLPTNRSLTAS